MNIYCLLFDDYETLDLMGPVEFLHRMPQARLHYFSRKGGLVHSRQGFSVMTESPATLSENGVLLVPGGQGTRTLADDSDFIRHLGVWIAQSRFILSVCTGSALVAATGCLDNRKATSNKRSFEWVRQVRRNVKWQPVARWVRDGKFYTSSGVSAGMDMTLGFIADMYGMDSAQNIALQTEYTWQYAPGHDDFAGYYGYGSEGSHD